MREALAANPQEASIWMDPPLAYEGRPLEFKPKFLSQALDTADAREEWTTEWDFGDGLIEQGWSVSHYFQLPRVPIFKRRQPKIFTVVATFLTSMGAASLTRPPTKGASLDP